MPLVECNWSHELLFRQVSVRFGKLRFHILKSVAWEAASQTDSLAMKSSRSPWRFIAECGRIHDRILQFCLQHESSQSLL
jgi:hypothetical protein